MQPTNLIKYTPWRITNYTKPPPNTMYNPTLDIVLVHTSPEFNKFRVVASGGGYWGYELHTIKIPKDYNNNGQFYYSQFEMKPITLEEHNECIETFLNHVPIRWISEEKKHYPDDFNLLMNMISPHLRDTILQKLLPVRSMK